MTHLHDDGAGGIWEHPGTLEDCPLLDCQVPVSPLQLMERIAELERRITRALEFLHRVPDEVMPGVPGHDHLSVRKAIAALDGAGEAE